MLWTWQNGDISNNPIYKGDYKKALAGIKAKAFVMPASTDLYFPPEDSANEVKHMPNAELRVVETYWGHFAGGPHQPRHRLPRSGLEGIARELSFLRYSLSSPFSRPPSTSDFCDFVNFHRAYPVGRERGIIATNLAMMQSSRCLPQSLIHEPLIGCVIARRVCQWRSRGPPQNISKYSRCSQSDTSAWNRSISAFLMWT